MKRIITLMVTLLAALIFISCSGNMEDTASNNNDLNVTAPTKAPVPTQAPMSKSTAESENENTQAVPVSPVIVDGYEITAATTGTALKDAYKDYFSIGVGLNGSTPVAKQRMPKP